MKSYLTNVVISGSESATSASEWCTANLRADEWDMRLHNQFNRYDFQFNNRISAIVFALKWSV